VGFGALGKPPIILPVGGPTSQRWGTERITAPPKHSGDWLWANAPTWAACGRALAPSHYAARLPYAVGYRLRLRASACHNARHGRVESLVFDRDTAPA